jgi:hypothetical protein
MGKGNLILWGALVVSTIDNFLRRARKRDHNLQTAFSMTLRLILHSATPSQLFFRDVLGPDKLR